MRNFRSFSRSNSIGRSVISGKKSLSKGLNRSNRRLAIALILGNEAKGMSVALKELCDQLVRIPITGAVNSLNVACAGSILLWDIYRNDRRRS
ncbi:MAG TPA: hypothetical protein DCL15_18550 [Chloroflexi bacterium]|nr:hypothetical protein [Chloroflexota bacterium]HHW88600.1 RNA methyltransferase [Chloroflexota bacterium]